MTPDSFNLGNPLVGNTINSVDAWGIKCIHYHMLMPERRPRKEQIPFRDGSYDYRDEYYNDRPLSVHCVLTRQITEDELDEIRYQLSRQNNIYFWDRPTKYYTCKIFESIPIISYQQFVMREFDLIFSCNPPFAIGESTTMSLTDGNNLISFPGTARTPTIITINNPNAYPITGITITVARRNN